MLSFVDNCNQRIIGEKYKELSNLLQQAQHNMKLWNNLVSVSGTKLELLKWFKQIIHFKFGINGAHIVGHIKDNLHLELIDCINNCPFQINPISPYITYKRLGTMQYIIKSKVSQMKQLKKKVVAHTWTLVSTKVNYDQAWIHHIMWFIPSVSYPLTVCYLNEFQLHSLQSVYLIFFKEQTRIPSKIFPQCSFWIVILWRPRLSWSPNWRQSQYTENDNM